MADLQPPLSPTIFLVAFDSDSCQQVLLECSEAGGALLRISPVLLVSHHPRRSRPIVRCLSIFLPRPVVPSSTHRASLLLLLFSMYTTLMAAHSLGPNGNRS